LRIPRRRSREGHFLETVVVDPFNYLALLEDADQVRNLQPDYAAIAKLGCSSLIVTATGDRGYDFVSRYSRSRIMSMHALDNAIATPHIGLRC